MAADHDQSSLREDRPEHASLDRLVVDSQQLISCNSVWPSPARFVKELKKFLVVNSPCSLVKVDLTKHSSLEMGASAR